jgi:hypothetical protein
MEKKMFNKIVIATTLASTVVAAPTIKSMDKKLSDMESRLEDLELVRDLNTFSFSGELEARYDSIQVEEKELPNGMGGTYEGNKWQNDRYTLFARLNFQSIPSRRASFYGRLSASKVMNAYGNRTVSFGGFTDGGGGRDLSGSDVHLERAFMNYKLTNSLTFSGGRLPTIDGPSYHMSAGKGRSGSYPSMAFGAIMDGFALTHAMNLGGGKLFTRFIWTPLGYKDFSQDYPARTTDKAGAKINTTDNMWSVMLDYENLTVSWADKINMIGQMVKFDELYVDATGVRCLDGDPSGTITVCSPDQGASGPVAPASDLYMGYDIKVLYFEGSNLFKSGFDFSWQMKQTTMSSRGHIYAAMDGNPNPIKISAFGEANTDGESSVDGSAMLMNLRYAVNNNFKLGFEYMNADDTVGLFDFQQNDPIHFYSTSNSTGQHIYGAYRIDNNFTTIVGYMSMNVKKSLSNFVFQGMPLSMNTADVDRSAMYVRFLGTF